MTDQSISPRQPQGAAVGRTGSGTGAPRARAVAPAWLIGVFMIALTLGVSFELAGLRLSPIRLLLLASFPPLLTMFVTGRLGRVGAVDWLLVGVALWMMLSFLVVEGAGRLPFATISVVEMFGSYLLGRYLVWSAATFRSMVSWHLIVLAIMLPFALVEFVTGTQYWARILDLFGNVVYRGPSSRPRLGFDRVLVGFDHPILYGIFCSMAAATAVYAFRGSPMATGLRLAFVGFMSFMSLSSGAVLSVMIQVLIMAWGLITGNRWKALAILVTALYVFLSFASNRGPVIIFIETLTFSSGTAWTRVAQWDYGSAEVLRNPIFGKGLDGDWLRPSWLYTSSIDNYWLVVAFRHGIPAITMLLGAIAILIWRIVRNRDLAADPDADRMRTGYMIVLSGVLFSLATVHIWNASVVFVFFFLGAGVWFADHRPTPGGTAAPEPVPGPRTAYSRFAPTPSSKSKSR